MLPKNAVQGVALAHAGIQRNPRPTNHAPNRGRSVTPEQGIHSSCDCMGRYQKPHPPNRDGEQQQHYHSLGGDIRISSPGEGDIDRIELMLCCDRNGDQSIDINKSIGEIMQGRENRSECSSPGQPSKDMKVIAAIQSFPDQSRRLTRKEVKSIIDAGARDESNGSIMNIPEIIPERGRYRRPRADLNAKSNELDSVAAGGPGTGGGQSRKSGFAALEDRVGRVRSRRRQQDEVSVMSMSSVTRNIRRDGAAGARAPLTRHDEEE
ncbi:hypothetical protein THAOC_08856, partial [Thalassiosira oceanica]